ncbi:MAG TPA: malto-oligosyltrehalose synthase, partial [Thermodesulfobacteriota bacterium]|nr:malto-oligosyltrehalose synthase [Thermodesulfobacteriota bacterium]
TEKDRHTRDFTLNSLLTALVEVIACFPVYRTYVNECGVIERDRHYVEQAVNRARRKNPAMSGTIFEYLKSVLLLKYPDDFNEADRAEWLDFVMRFQQVTGPVMAKGMEDTVFYVYNRLISLNEVGGNPEKFGVSLESFHQQNLERNRMWPHQLNATSTHDTKRSEDVRARINVLSEIPEEWRIALGRWSRLNKKKKTLLEDEPAPDRNEEYLLYQTLLGAWPLDLEAPDEAFRQRIRDYAVKAVREAKVNSSWISPNAAHEEALLKFVDSLLDPSPDNFFLKDMGPLRRKVSFFGMLNSLSQTLLKIALPGVPEFYQGSEIWDFSLVDPDNRRPVDFRRRMDILKSVQGGREDPGKARALLQDWKSGAVKFYVCLRSLHFRRENPLLFGEGEYLPLESRGALAENACAFARVKSGASAVMIVPRLLTRVTGGRMEAPLGDAWGDSSIVQPQEVPGAEFRNVFTGAAVRGVGRNGRTVLPLAEVFAHFPVALLASK